MKKTCAPPNFYDLRVSIRSQLSTSYKYKPFLMEQETNKNTQKANARVRTAEPKATEKEPPKEQWALINTHSLTAERGELATYALDFRITMDQRLPPASWVTPSCVYFLLSMWRQMDCLFGSQASPSEELHPRILT